MERNFKNKVVLVSGGSRGIGKAIALAFASHGASVAVLYLKNQDIAGHTLEEIRQRGSRCMALRCDVRDWEAVRGAVEKVTAEMGEIDILINCAGIVKDSLIVLMDVADWRSVIETNLDGAFHCMKAVAERMLLRRKGSIINVSSLSAARGGKGQANYAASKAGLNALTRAAALELAPRGITVNAVAPGMVITEMSATVRELVGDALKKSIPMRRFASPEDIVGTVLFLSSPDASYITGQVIDIDGGLGAAVH
ncbi:MAG: 3-oxoacyl-ACP reductase FabG [Candidatus Aureabacteria bacterium]|nr:3-oxoacyl-ACP reductase FabG [Candidatus Auribacterota bacterium]